MNVFVRFAVLADLSHRVLQPNDRTYSVLELAPTTLHRYRRNGGDPGRGLM